MNEHLTDRSYEVRLVRPNTGSAITLSVVAVSTAQAQRKADDLLRLYQGWSVESVK